MMEFYKYPSHAIGGNLSAYCWYENYEKSSPNMDPANRFKPFAKIYQKKQFGGWYDTKWMDSLNPNDLSMIIQTPGINDVANLVGYSITDLVSKYSQYHQLKKI